MANRYRGDIDIELEGKTYTLNFSLNTLITLVDKHGADFEDKFTTAAALGLVRDVMAMALVKHHGKMNEEDVGEMMDPKKVEYYAQKVMMGLAVANGGDIDELERVMEKAKERAEKGKKVGESAPLKAKAKRVRELKSTGSKSQRPPM